MVLCRFISTRLRMKSTVATVSTAISFALIIVSLAVASGFRREISGAVADMCGDFRIIPVSGVGDTGSDPVDFSSPVFDSILAVRGVKCLRPVIYRGGIVQGDEDVHGVLFKGEEGVVDSLAFIPSKLSSLLKLRAGDRLPAYFVGDELRIRSFTVGGIYDGIVTADDKLVVNCGAAVLRKLNGWRENEVSAVEVALDGALTAADRDVIEYELNAILYEAACEKQTLICENVRGAYSQLFDWLGLVDSNVRLILFLMILVAGFNMVTGLLIFIFNSASSIGLLKSLGMRPVDISAAFLLSASRSVLAGMLAGNAVAVAVCLFQDKFRILHLDPDNYFISFVPMNIEPAALVLYDLLAFVAIMLILTIPCLYISRIEPSVTLKSE